MIEVKDLHFTYPGNSVETIRGIDFNIDKGEIFGFLGPSGAGKSTTQKILIGVLCGFNGKISVLGRPLASFNTDYYENIGVAFEFPNLYTKFTALENLQFFSSLYSGESEDPMKLLEMVHLEDAAKKRVGDFSKGMKMRLNFCRALLNKPDILFLDEPTSGLDPVNARRMMDIIREKKEAGCTIFLTTHNMHVADELCDRVAFMVDGELVLIDSPEKLKVQRGRRAVRVEWMNGNGLESREFHLDGLADNVDYLHLLREQRIETMHTMEASLDDIFIDVTGRSLV